MRKKSAITLILVILCLGLGLAFFYPEKANHQAGSFQDPPLPAPPKAVLDAPVAITPFKLTQQGLTPFDLDDLRGKWSFLFFGYTHCPDVCPTTLTELAQAYSLLMEQPGILTDTQFVFVSVDPERDSPETLADYVGYFNADFVGATGTALELEKLTGQVGIKYKKGDKTETGYIMNHSSAVLLIDPQARYYARFSAPHYSEVISRQYLAIRRYYETFVETKSSKGTE